MKLLDLFACEGGAAAGYHRAGWEVTGVDLDANRLKRYPFERYVADALTFARDFGTEFDAIHASPPCQGYTRGNAGRETAWPKLIPETRAALEATGLPYVIENVKDAGPEMVNPVGLCGCMFNLSTIDTDGVTIHLQRLRLFETNWGLTAPRPCDHSAHEWVAGAYGGARRDKYEAKYVRKGGYVPPDKDVVKRLLGIEHDMTWNGLFECIPPAFRPAMTPRTVTCDRASRRPDYSHPRRQHPTPEARSRNPGVGTVTDKPCDRCVIIPTPDGKCICRKETAK